MAPAAPEARLGTSDRARTARACDQCREIRGALDGQGSRRYLLGRRRQRLHHRLDRARRAARVCTEAPRVRHHSHGSDGGAKRRWCCGPRLCALRADLALDLSSRERAGALVGEPNFRDGKIHLTPRTGELKVRQELEARRSAELMLPTAPGPFLQSEVPVRAPS